MKLRNKASLVVILSLLLLVVLAGTYAYSRYFSAARMNGNINVAVWSIKVNGCNIVDPNSNPMDIRDQCFESETITNEEDNITQINLIRNFRITEDSITYYPLENEGLVGNNKIGPGTEARFNISIDPGATEAAFKYDLMAKYDDERAQIRLFVIELDCPNGTDDGTCVTKKDENGVEIEHPLIKDEISDEGTIAIDNPYQNMIYFSEDTDNRKQFLQVKVLWVNDETGNSDKSDTEIGTVEKPVLHIPVSIVFQQITFDSDVQNNPTEDQVNSEDEVTE